MRNRVRFKAKDTRYLIDAVGVASKHAKRSGRIACPQLYVIVHTAARQSEGTDKQD